MIAFTEHTYMCNHWGTPVCLNNDIPILKVDSEVPRGTSSKWTWNKTPTLQYNPTQIQCLHSVLYWLTLSQIKFALLIVFSIVTLPSYFACVKIDPHLATFCMLFPCLASRCGGHPVLPWVPSFDIVLLLVSSLARHMAEWVVVVKHNFFLRFKLFNL